LLLRYVGLLPLVLPAVRIPSAVGPSISLSFREQNAGGEKTRIDRHRHSEKFLKGPGRECEQMRAAGFQAVWKEPEDSSAVSVTSLPALSMTDVQDAQINDDQPVTVLVRMGDSRVKFWFNMFFTDLDLCPHVGRFIFDWWGDGDLFSETRMHESLDQTNRDKIKTYLDSGRVRVVTGREYSHRYFRPEGLNTTLVLNLDDDSFLNCQGLRSLLAAAAESNGKKIITFHNFTRSLATYGAARTEQHPCDASLGYDYEFPPHAWENPGSLKPLGAMVLPGLSLIPSLLFDVYEKRMPAGLLKEITKTVDCDDIALSVLTALENKETDSEAGIAVKLGEGGWFLWFDDGLGLWHRDNRRNARRQCLSTVLKAFKAEGIIDDRWLPHPISRLLVPSEELGQSEEVFPGITTG